MVDNSPVGSGLLQEPVKKDKKPRWDWRLIAIRCCVVIAFSVLLAQLWRLQIVEGHSFQQLADINRFRVSPVPAPRGIIYDRNHKMIAANTPSFQVSIVPAGLPADKNEASRVFLQLSSLLGISPVDITERLEKRKGDDFTPVAVKFDVDREIVLQVEERHLKLPGVIVVPESSRLYPFGPLLSHILGYMLPVTEEQMAELEADQEAGYRAEDRIGATGIEAEYEKILRGKPGKKLYEVDATERPVSDLTIVGPDPGNNLVLSIDVDLQKEVERLLQEGMGESQQGVALVMAPKTGQLLAMVSLPSYDNNLFSGRVRGDELEAILNDPRRPMINYAISGTFPPGSIYKLVTASAALQEGVATSATEIICNGALLVPNQYNPALSQRLPCWGVHGKQNFVQGLANSCDVYYWTLGGGTKDFDGLGNERLGMYAATMGYGSATGIDLPDEVKGLVPSEQWKLATWAEPWLKGDTYNMSIGQGFVLATPLQVANATNAIANGGRLLRPRIATAVTDAEDRVVKQLEPEELHRLPVSQANLAVVVEGMKAVMTADDQMRKMNVPELKIAGKTGSAEYPGVRDAKGILPTHGWFTSFAPYDDPQVSVTVFLQSGGGPSDAAPLAMKIMKRFFNYSEPAPAPAATR